MSQPSASAPLVPNRLLFQFAAPLLWRKSIWSDAGGAKLGEECQLPSLSPLERHRPFADVRGAWNAEGLVFSVALCKKSQAPWCHENRMNDSDGLHLWIDTRATHNVHRATRFCQRFAFLPNGGGRNRTDPLADQLLIDRARENAKPVRLGLLRARVERRTDGYLLEALIPTAAMTGYDPEEHPKLGFTYAVLDREQGVQTFTVGPELPFTEDPSLWATLELVGDKDK